MKLKALSLAGVVVSLFAFPALAHHSFSMYNQNELTTLSGTVTEYEWINPHAWVHVAVMDKSGQVATWPFETGSTRQIAQSGWTRDTLKPGDQIDVEFHPLMDGSYGGHLRKITFPDGRWFCQGRACREAAQAAAGE